MPIRAVLEWFQTRRLSRKRECCGRSFGFGKLLWLLCLGFGFLVRNASSTQFGGVATLDAPESTLRSILIPQWQSGGLSWIRASSRLLADEGFNQVAILRWVKPSAQIAGGKDLPDDLLALYWHCRTNLPVFPQVHQAWEVWNEPDFYFVAETPDRMAAVLKAAYWGIKAGNTNARALMPSLAFTPGKYEFALLQNQAFSYTDGYNFHYYGWPQDFLAAIRQHQKFVRRYHLLKPLWVTEAGDFQMLRTDATNASELARQQALHERLTVTAWVAGIDVYLPFILTPYVESGFDLSLVTDEFEPRPGLDSYLTLSAMLKQSKPLYQIYHRPTGEEVGCVFRDPEGLWRTVLWSPRRWKDLSLPVSKSIAEGAAPTSQIPATDFGLSLRFAPGNDTVRIGLNTVKALDAGTRRLDVKMNAQTNFHLLTSPQRFEIHDCEWREISPRLKPVDDPSGPVVAMGQRRPSPVVIQMNFHPEDVVADKPSQTYRYKPGCTIEAVVSIYNFSNVDQRGALTLKLPPGWTCDLQPCSVRKPSKQLPEDARLSLAVRYRKREKVGSLVRKDISLRIETPSAEWKSWESRVMIEGTWRGPDSITDRFVIWLEPQQNSRSPSQVFEPDEILTKPTQPMLWEMVSSGSGSARLRLAQPTPASGFVSLFYSLPEGVRLNPKDYLCINIRAAARHAISSRVELITRGKEVFGYGEDQDVANVWTSFNFRLGDFGRRLWSHLGSDWRMPWTEIRFLRISFEGLAQGDEIEIRNFGLATGHP